MSLVVVGSVALDTVETPKGRADDVLGGAALYFSLAASFFAPVRMVGVVGADFPRATLDELRKRDIDLSGVEEAPGKTFRWTGRYHEDVNVRDTLHLDLGVFAEFRPKLPEAYRDSAYVFLANIDPVLQRRVREAMPGVKLVAGDTMNYWIKDHKAALLEVLKGLDILLINDTEARMLAAKDNLVQAARAVMAMGPSSLIVKHGEYGATLFHKAPANTDGAEKTFRAPALPLEEVVDPTGAGDSFAGGFFGYLASQPDVTPASYRNAMFYGSVMGSFAVERFGTERLQMLSRDEIDARFALFRELTHLD